VGEVSEHIACICAQVQLRVRRPHIGAMIGEDNCYDLRRARPSSIAMGLPS
jgi:hypothetical protein